VTLLTFNQDLVIENEIFKRARLRERWCLQHAYGTFGTSHDFTTPSRGPTFPLHTADCDLGNTLKVLKLHGSLNWFVRMNGRQPRPRVLSGTAGDRTVMVTTRRTVPTQLVFNRTGARRGRSQWYTWPVIIPPVYAKQALIQAFVPEVWQDAKSELQTADRVVFFGYPLPEADIDAEKLLQRAITNNAGIKMVEVIDPNPSIAARYARLIPSKPLVWFPSVQTYLEQEPFQMGH
jgi:hypothetical protein